MRGHPDRQTDNNLFNHIFVIHVPIRKKPLIKIEIKKKSFSEHYLLFYYFLCTELTELTSIVLL